MKYTILDVAIGQMTRWYQKDGRLDNVIVEVKSINPTTDSLVLSRYDKYDMKEILFPFPLATYLWSLNKCEAIIVSPESMNYAIKGKYQL